MLLLFFFNSGFTTILNYILNYYSGVDTEVRDPRGFTALIKAGLQGREECVSALLMHGKFMVHKSTTCVCIYTDAVGKCKSLALTLVEKLTHGTYQII